MDGKKRTSISHDGDWKKFLLAECHSQEYCQETLAASISPYSRRCVHRKLGAGRQRLALGLQQLSRSCRMIRQNEYVSGILLGTESDTVQSLALRHPGIDYQESSGEKKKTGGFIRAL